MNSSSKAETSDKPSIQEVQAGHDQKSILKQDTLKVGSSLLPSSTASPSGSVQDVSSSSSFQLPLKEIRKVSKATARRDPSKSILITAPTDNDDPSNSQNRGHGVSSDLPPENASSRPRAKSMIVMGHKPVAFFMESETESKSGVNSDPIPTANVSNHSLPSKQKQSEARTAQGTPPSTNERPKPKEPGISPAKTLLKVPGAGTNDNPKDTEAQKTSQEADNAPTSEESKSGSKRRVRTFRIWNPSQDRKSILVKVGDENGENEAEKIFQSSQMRHKSFKEWHRQAKSTLPSVSGGPPIQKVADIIEMAPTLQKEEDPRNLERAIRRLSLDSEIKEVRKSLERRKSSEVKDDYTKFREIDNSPPKKDEDDDEDEDEEEEDDEEEDEDDDDSFTKELGSSDEEERQREKERKQAGIDIKEKVKTLKELADHLTVKRGIRQQLIQKATGLVLLDTEQIPFKEHILYMIEDAANLLHDGVDRLAIWEAHIRQINGSFGAVIASYFVWLRQMVALEIFAFIVTCAIIIIPQVVEDIEDPNSGRNNYPFSIYDIINGEGYFHHSYLYYSGYHARNEDSYNPFHNPAFRFIFCMLFMFFILTYFIFSRLTRYYQSVRMESKVSGVAHMNHFKSIICGWDYSCRDTQSAFYLHKTISRELYILARASEHTAGIATVVHEMQQKKLLNFAVSRFGVFWGPWVIHIVGNVLILLACTILGIILVNLCDLKLFYYVKCVSLRDGPLPKTPDHKILCPNGSQYLSTWILSLPALFASMTTLMLTKLIVIVGDSETWNTPERKVYATMIRAGLFNFTNIGVFYTYWISKKPILKEEGYVAETIFGKELYRLVVIQGMVDVVLNIGVKGIYHCLRRKREGYKMTEFRTEHCSLSMFFIHSVSRIGTLFCPPLSIFVTLRLILDFYQNKYALLNLSARESYSAHASHMYAPFLLTFFILCYLITSFMNVYYITDTSPSSYNGPFVKYTSTHYDEVLSLLLKSDQGISWLRILAQPGFLVILNGILLGLVYFCRAWGRAYEPLIEHLNEHIAQERADRELLLKAIFEIGKVTIDQIAGDKKPSKMRRSTLIEAVKTIQPEEDDEEEVLPQENVKKEPQAPVKKEQQVPVKKEQEAQVKKEQEGVQIGHSQVSETRLKVEGPHPTLSRRSTISIASSVYSGDISKIEEKVDEEIDQLIYGLKRRRTIDTNRLSFMSSPPDPAGQQTQPSQGLRRKTTFASPQPLDVEVDKKTALGQKRRKSQAALDDKAMRERLERMNRIVANIVSDRKQLLKGSQKTGTQPSSSSTAIAAKNPVTAKPATLQQQLDTLSVVKSRGPGAKDKNLSRSTSTRDKSAPPAQRKR